MDMRAWGLVNWVLGRVLDSITLYAVFLLALCDGHAVVIVPVA